MTGRLQAMAAAGALLSAAAPLWADEAATQPSVQAELRALRAEIAELRQSQRHDWMTERQAEEVRTLVREVLADAETRATLLQDGMTAGYDDGFFLASPDDSFRLEIGGQMQFRWIGNMQDGRDDEHEADFQIRRTKLGFSGHLATPDLGYEIVVAADRADGSVSVEDFVINYELGENWELSAGKFKLPFLREELLSSKRQLAVDRSSVTEFFTLDRSEQIALHYASDFLRAAASINDGADEEFSDFGADPVEFATTGRVDLKLAGDWGQMKDLVAWPGEGLGVFLGGAAHYQAGDGSNADFGSESEADYLAWTLDGLYEQAGLSLMGAFHGGHVTWDDNLAMADRNMYGFEAQAGYAINEQWQPFVRYEWIDPDSDSDEVQIATAGVNYFLNKHNAKFTTDVVWVFDGEVPASNPFGNSPFSSGLGLAGFGGAEDDALIALRAQFQLVF